MNEKMSRILNALNPVQRQEKTAQDLSFEEGLADVLEAVASKADCEEAHAALLMQRRNPLSENAMNALENALSALRVKRVELALIEATGV